MSEDADARVPDDPADLAGLSGPAGLGPGEKVPNQVRILAMRENLGNLLSVHRPSSWVTRLQWRDARLYVYDQGLVVCRGQGSVLRLFRVGAMRIRKLREYNYVLAGPQGPGGFGFKQWTGREELKAAVEAWAPAHPWT